jgi:CRISPR system Cascade subunit CasB
MSVEFEPDSMLGKALYGWWTGLEEDKGGRAELRRCDDAVQVVMTPVFQRQHRIWQPHFSDQQGYEDRLAQIVGLLSHVKTSRNDVTLARQMATARGGEPAVSELRFRRLIQRERDDLYPAMIRILRLLDGEANIYDLAQSIYYWGDDRRKRWAYDYYGHLKPQR